HRATHHAHGPAGLRGRVPPNQSGPSHRSGSARPLFSGVMIEFPEKLFVNGEWRAPSGDRRIRLINPANEEPLVEVRSAELAEVAVAVEGAQLAWKQTWRDIAPGKRAEIL